MNTNWLDSTYSQLEVLSEELSQLNMDLADVNAQRLAARQLYNHNGTAAERSRQKELIQLFDSDLRSLEGQIKAVQTRIAILEKNIPQTNISSKIPKTDDVMWDTYLITFESTLLNNLVPKEKGYPLYLRFIAKENPSIVSFINGYYKERRENATWLEFRALFLQQVVTQASRIDRKEKILKMTWKPTWSWQDFVGHVESETLLVDEHTRSCMLEPIISMLVNAADPACEILLFNINASTVEELFSNARKLFSVKRRGVDKQVSFTSKNKPAFDSSGIPDIVKRKVTREGDSLNWSGKLWQ